MDDEVNARTVISPGFEGLVSIIIIVIIQCGNINFSPR